jgi:hypothetical protein
MLLIPEVNPLIAKPAVVIAAAVAAIICLNFSASSRLSSFQISIIF